MEKTFAEEVDEGLSAKPKYLSSKYHYDDQGSRIFQEIMAMPEYYLTDCEFEILSMQVKDIYDALGFDGHFNIIELGAGDGLKTKELLRNLLEIDADFTYVPIDISQEAIDILVDKMQESLPKLDMNPQVGDYFEVMDEVEAKGSSPNLVLFLGSNIGNFKDEWAVDLLKHMHEHMRSGDKLLVGFDLRKNPNLIRDAYDDPHGITKRFNLNVLARINRELDADFELDKFDFYCHYNPDNGEVRSYLVSLREQDVEIKAIGKIYHFERNELIWSELSKKYTPTEIEELSKKAGFEFQQHFLDCMHHFSDSLYTKP
jgi:dimethylhistidine N-methyltransferase